MAELCSVQSNTPNSAEHDSPVSAVGDLESPIPLPRPPKLIAMECLSTLDCNDSEIWNISEHIRNKYGLCISETSKTQRGRARTLQNIQTM
jgi:hypothetical protein